MWVKDDNGKYEWKEPTPEEYAKAEADLIKANYQAVSDSLPLVFEGEGKLVHYGGLELDGKCIAWLFEAACETNGLNTRMTRTHIGRLRITIERVESDRE